MDRTAGKYTCNKVWSSEFYPQNAQNERQELMSSSCPRTHWHVCTYTHVHTSTNTHTHTDLMTLPLHTYDTHFFLPFDCRTFLVIPCRSHALSASSRNCPNSILLILLLVLLPPLRQLTSLTLKTSILTPK